MLLEKLLDTGLPPWLLQLGVTQHPSSHPGAQDRFHSPAQPASHSTGYSFLQSHLQQGSTGAWTVAVLSQTLSFLRSSIHKLLIIPGVNMARAILQKAKCQAFLRLEKATETAVNFFLAILQAVWVPYPASLSCIFLGNKTLFSYRRTSYPTPGKIVCFSQTPL